MLLAALPVFGMRLAVSDEGNDPSGSTTRIAYDRLAEGFGAGVNGPLLIVVEDPTNVGAIAESVRVERRGRVRRRPAHESRRGDQRVRRLPHDLAAIPGDRATGSRPARRVACATLTSAARPHRASTSPPSWPSGCRCSSVPCCVVSFLLLLAVFRSLLVPLKAVVLNLVSIGAAYGAMVAVFQWGWFASVSNIEPAPIEPWAPMMLFAIVFGLSMDYEVFLLSAVKERYDETRDNHAAVLDGLSSTARVITAAAAIMVCVFASFMVADLRSIKLIGFGLAAAVFIDATIVPIGDGPGDDGAARQVELVAATSSAACTAFCQRRAWLR